MKITNKIIAMKLSIVLITIFSLHIQSDLFAQTINIYTPEGYRDNGYVNSEFSAAQIASLAIDMDTMYIQKYSLNAVLVANASNRYACHAYAWQISEGSKDTVDSCSDKYWDDQVVSPSDNLPSYLPQGRFNSGQEADATHSLDEYHSTRKIQSSYPRSIEGGRDYISKWGYAGLYQHAKNHEPYYLGSNLDENGNPVSHIFKKLKTDHHGILASYPKTWIGAGGITHNITQDLTVNTTLTIMPGATVNFQNGITVTINGTVNIYSDLTIPTGVNLVINSGAVLNFASSTSLIINGTFSANGGTITRIGSTGSWGSIRLNSGCTANIQNCNISYATYGVYCYSNSNVILSNNTISNCSSAGIYCYGSSPYLTNNLLQNNNYGINCIYSSQVKLGASGGGYGNNIIKQNSIGVRCDNSNVQMGTSSTYGHNSIFSNSYKAVYAVNSSIVPALNNYWGTSTPPSSLFETYGSSTIDFSSPLSSDPNLSMKSPKDNRTSLPSIQSVDETGVIDSDLMAALEAMNRGKYEDAIIAFTDKYKKENDLDKKRFSLVELAECYRLSGRKDFSGFLNAQARNSLKTTDELYAVTIELENSFLMQEGKYDQAIVNLNILLNNYSKIERVEKNALFNLGYLNYFQLGNKEKGKSFFNDLANKYPEDELASTSKILFGNTPGNEYNGGKLIETKSIINGSLEINNYPNPFNPSTNISFTLPQRSNVKLVVYDVLGKEVATLANSVYETGKYDVTFNASNLPSGVYFYSITTAQGTISKKMLLVK